MVSSPLQDHDDQLLEEGLMMPSSSVLKFFLGNTQLLWCQLSSFGRHSSTFRGNLMFAYHAWLGSSCSYGDFRELWEEFVMVVDQWGALNLQIGTSLPFCETKVKSAPGMGLTSAVTKIYLREQWTLDTSVIPPSREELLFESTFSGKIKWPGILGMLSKQHPFGLPQSQQKVSYILWPGSSLVILVGRRREMVR